MVIIHIYTSLIVLLSLTIILPVLDGCAPLGVAMLMTVVGVVRVAGVGVEVVVLRALLPFSLHCTVTQTSARLMLGPLTAHTFTLSVPVLSRTVALKWTFLLLSGLSESDSHLPLYTVHLVCKPVLYSFWVH